MKILAKTLSMPLGPYDIDYFMHLVANKGHAWQAIDPSTSTSKFADILPCHVYAMHFNSGIYTMWQMMHVCTRLKDELLPIALYPTMACTDSHHDFRLMLQAKQPNKSHEQHVQYLQHINAKYFGNNADQSALSPTTIWLGGYYGYARFV